MSIYWLETVNKSFSELKYSLMSSAAAAPIARLTGRNTTDSLCCPESMVLLGEGGEGRVRLLGQR